MRGLKAPPPPKAPNYWELRSKLVSGASEPNQTDAEFSRKWNTALQARLEKTSTGRDLLAKLDGRLPEVEIEVQKEPWIASYSGSDQVVYLTSGKMADEIEAGQNRGWLDSILPSPDKPDPQLPHQLKTLLNNDPALMGKVLDGYEPWMVHELTHAVQDRSFSETDPHGRESPDTQDKELHAFSVQNAYYAERLRQEPGFGGGKSRLQVSARENFKDYNRDYDDYLRDIRSWKTYVKMPTERQLREGEGRSPASYDEQRGAFYDQYFAHTRDQWRRKSAEAYLMMAEDKLPKDEIEATIGSSVALSRLGPDAPAALKEMETRLPRLKALLKSDGNWPEN
jgi:hypothetical protein